MARCKHYVEAFDCCAKTSEFIEDVLWVKSCYYKDDVCPNCRYFEEKEEVVPVKWISVKDRLPEENGKYLVAYYSSQFKRYFIDLSYYETSNEGAYFCNAEGYKRRADYWMPLPEPPKKEGADNG